MARNFTFDGQHEDEEIIHVFRHHPIVMRKGLIGFLIFIVVGFLPVTIYPENLNLLWLVLAGFVLGALYMFYAWISWYYSIYIITDQRFVQISQKGLFHRTIVDLGLDKVQNINSQIAGLQQTLLSFGTIIIQTYVGDLVLENIHHPQDIQTKLIKVIKKHGYNTPEEE
jgi:uncharacterized membrane protein YdbT with pleckstrin-like domain